MNNMTKISAVVTCFNNQDTIEKCIASVAFADEIIVLDSFSTDATLEILKKFNCIVKQQKFKGFWQQKQDAINLATHDWVILLDSDEFLTRQAQSTIQKWQQKTAQFDAYALPRREWVFWQWSHKFVHKNSFVRLFNRQKAQVSQDLVHESIKTTGSCAKLNAEIKHFGETSIALKIEKINQYSSLAAQQKYAQGKRVLPIKLVFYPIWYFFKQYFIRRQIFNGTAGLINAYLNSKYAFLKYAKLYELQKNKN
ncbi:MAG TPA: glycosyltransferase family 2 protein [Oceanospirillales bacterium]|nr:glycosyltransferase family 2 protein [Oceanospirillales bacterium]